ncbi:MAG: hypothetical protein ACK4N5_26210, partial [Myxococcales bacterium]
DLDLTGTGELVLTEPAVARSAVAFGAAASGRYVLASLPRSDVVVEIDKVAGRPLRLAVPPGRYLLRKRTGRSTGLLEVELSYGGTRHIDDKDLVFRDFAEVAMKGETVELKPWLVLGAFSTQSAPIARTGPRFVGSLGLRRTFSEWFVTGRLGATAASYRGRELLIRERAAALSATAGYRWLSLPVIPWVGVSGELMGMRQTITRDREEEILRIGAPAIAPRDVLAPALGGSLGLEVPTPSDLVLLLQLDVLGRYLPVDERPPVRAVAQGTLAAAWRF